MYIDFAMSVKWTLTMLPFAEVSDMSHIVYFTSTLAERRDDLQPCGWSSFAGFSFSLNRRHSIDAKNKL